MTQNPYESPLCQPGRPAHAAKEYPLTLPGFEGQELVVRTPGFFSGAKLIVNGKPATVGPKRGQLILRRNDGKEVVTQLRITNFIDPVPKVVVDGQAFTVAEPLKWYQCVWAGVPFTLICIGGLLGGLCGGIATMINGRIFRSELSPATKYLVTGIITVVAIFAFVALAIAFNIAIGNR